MAPCIGRAGGGSWLVWVPGRAHGPDSARLGLHVRAPHPISPPGQPPARKRSRLLNLTGAHNRAASSVLLSPFSPIIRHRDLATWEPTLTETDLRFTGLTQESNAASVLDPSFRIEGPEGRLSIRFNLQGLTT